MQSVKITQNLQKESSWCLERCDREIFFGVKSLMGTPLDWKIFRHQKKISYGPGVRKASKSKSASVRLKTYLNEKKHIKQFLWVKTPMGIQRKLNRVKRFRKFLRFSWKSGSKYPMGKRSSLHEDFVCVKTPMGLERFEVGFFFRPNLNSLGIY